jgi:predicted metalloendopeptidase
LKAYALVSVKQLQVNYQQILRMLTSISTENINGSNQTTSKDERALQVINGRIGEALGKLYVEKIPS